MSTDLLSAVDSKPASYEFVPNFISPEIAQKAGEEALWLCAQKGLYLVRYIKVYDEYMAYGVNARPNSQSQNEQLEAVKPSISTLLGVRDTMNKRIGSNDPLSFIINVTAPKGRVHKHRDNHCGQTFAANLLGDGEAFIYLPRKKQPVTLTLRPGDGFELYNSLKRRKNLLHEVRNRESKHYRVSLVKARVDHGVDQLRKLR